MIILIVKLMGEMKNMKPQGRQPPAPTRSPRSVRPVVEFTPDSSLIEGCVPGLECRCCSLGLRADMESMGNGLGLRVDICLILLGSVL